MDRHIRLLLVAPAVILILLLTVYPLVYSLWIDFVTYDIATPGHAWVGLGNFRSVWSDPIARDALWITLELSFACVAAELVLGLALALAMVRSFRGRRWVMTLFVMPLFVSPVVVGTFFSLILTQPFGPTNYLLGELLGHPVTVDFTNSSPWVYISIILADTWQWTPFMFVILLAGLTSISDELYHAADLDGAKPRQAFFFITLPQLLPIALLAITFRLVDSFKLFDVIFVLTRGGPGTDTYTASYYLYQQGFTFFHIGQGTAGSWMLMLVILALSYPLVKRILKPMEV